MLVYAPPLIISQTCLFANAVDRVHRPDVGQMPTLQESVSSYKRFIQYITTLSLDGHILYYALRHLTEAFIQSDLTKTAAGSSIRVFPSKRLQPGN